MIIITATKTEAHPLIASLNLSRIQIKPFSIYANKKHHLIISGIGKMRAGVALSHILTKIQEPIINIGYAAGDEIGKIYTLYKVIDADINAIYRPKKLEQFPQNICTTYSTPSTKPQKGLADMEASALCTAANIYKTPISFIKIVSDNFDPKSFVKNSYLIEEHLSSIIKATLVRIS